jgi:type II secretory pathway pseudopilin PulG
MRAGITLVEIVVAALVLSMAFAASFTIFFHGVKREAKLDFHMRALQTAALARTRLADDFSQILPVASNTPASAQGQAVAFDRIEEGPGTGPGGLPITDLFVARPQSVTYRFDPNSHQLLRNGHPVAVGLFHNVLFVFSATQDLGYTLEVHLELAPEEELLLPGKPSQLARFRFAFHSPQGTLSLAHREWAGDLGL